MLVRLKSEIFLFSLLVLDSLKGSEITCMKYVRYTKLCLTLFMMVLFRAVWRMGAKTIPMPPTPLRKIFYIYPIMTKLGTEYINHLTNSLLSVNLSIFHQKSVIFVTSWNKYEIWIIINYLLSFDYYCVVERLFYQRGSNSDDVSKTDCSRSS